MKFYDDNTLRLWFGDKGWQSQELKGHTHYVTSVSWHPSVEEKLLASGSDDRTLRLWDINLLQCLYVLKVESKVDSVFFSHDGKWLSIGCSDTSVRVYSFTKNKILLFWTSANLLYSQGANISRALLSAQNAELLKQRGAVTTLQEEKKTD